MKKYILLATTAVLMTTANAFADPVTVSLPTLGVEAKLTPLAAFTKTANLNFGGVVFDKTALTPDYEETDFVSFGTIWIGSDTPDYHPTNVKAHYGTTSRGKYTYTGSLNLDGGTFTIGGESCSLVSGMCSIGTPIDLGTNAKVQQTNIQCTATPDKECFIGTMLLVRKTYLEGLESTATLNENLTITYNY